MKCCFSSMKVVIKWVSICCVMLLSCNSVYADAAAEKVLKKARLAAALQNQDLEGTIRKKGKKYPLRMFLRGKGIQFEFYVNKQWDIFQMRQGTTGWSLLESSNSKWTNFKAEKLVQPIANTDVTYEDLAMKFLYWKKAQIIKQEKIKTQVCDVVWIENPGKTGNYKFVYAWVSQKQGAIMRVVGYDAQRKPIKQFAVEKLMNVDGYFTLRTMRVDKYDPASGKSIGVTYIEFKEPKDDDDDL